MVKCCFVPGCKSGYRSCKYTCSLFRAPSDQNELQKWRKAIARDDRLLTHKDHVCELHFAPECILHSYTVVVGNERCSLPRGCAKLVKGAVPHIFPILPPARQRKRPVQRLANIPAKVQKATSNDSHETDGGQCLFNFSHLPSESSLEQ